MEFMVDMMQTDIFCEQLQYFGQLVIRTPSQRSLHWAPALMTTPVCLELVLAVEQPHTNSSIGTFSKYRRIARKGRNPQTGEAVKIKASTVVKFKAGKKLKGAI